MITSALILGHGVQRYAPAQHEARGCRRRSAGPGHRHTGLQLARSAFRSSHLRVAVLSVMVLLAYFFPADPLPSGRETAVGEGDMRHADHDDTRAAIADGMYRLTFRNVGAARHDPGDRRHFRSCRQFQAELRRRLAPEARTQVRLPRHLPRCADRHLDRARQPSPQSALAGPAAACLPELLAKKSRSGFLALAGPASGHSWPSTCATEPGVS